jgi:hypothetical protein
LIAGKIVPSVLEALFLPLREEQGLQFPQNHHPREDQPYTHYTALDLLRL